MKIGLAGIRADWPNPQGGALAGVPPFFVCDVNGY